MAERFSVVVSLGHSEHPSKRNLEDTIIAELQKKNGLDVVVIPHVYDAIKNGHAHQVLQSIPGHFILLSWLPPRAAHWTVAHFGIRGQIGITIHTSSPGPAPTVSRSDSPEQRVMERQPVPDRTIYHLDLRSEDKPETYLGEIDRIVQEYCHEPGTDRAVHSNLDRKNTTLTRAEEKNARRWYPVIDYSRCTNCMECVDFCLFGVYGIDHQETILVEQPDTCRKGCPACSRVCPENAIMFPHHKTPLIAGDGDGEGKTKIDLSSLFGSPSDEEVAQRERDEHLRGAGPEVNQPTAEADAPRHGQAGPEKDELDELLDELDRADL